MKLTVLLSDGTRLDHPVAEGTVSIGRSRKNTLVVADPQLSRHHAEIAESPRGGWVVRDLGSLNGTQLNGVALTTEQPFRDGDVLTLGGTTIHAGDPPTSPHIDLRELSEIRVTEGTIHALPERSAGPRGLSRLVFDAARAMVATDDSAVVLATILQLALEATSAERGLIATLSGTRGLLPLAAIPPWSGADLPWISRAVQERVLGRGESVIVDDIHQDEVLRGRETIVGAQVRSILCAPIGDRGANRGVFYLDSVAHKARFDTTHLEAATVLAGLASLTLEADQARRDLERRRVLEAELEAAAAIQRSLMPHDDPPVRAGFTAAGRQIPCRGIGGDVYDLFPWGDAGYGLMVADVAGKGLSAALLGSNLLARWKTILCSKEEPAQWLPRLNDELCDMLPENRFVTLAFALADAAAGRALYASAGQASLLIRDGAVHALDATGPVLGLFGGTRFDVHEIPFPTGSRLIAFSDGLTDQRSKADEPFEMERLRALLADASAKGGPARALLVAVLDALENHARDAERDDDTTVAILARD